MNIKPINKSKQKTKINNNFNNKGKKIRKKSPKIIDYNKVAQKYGNLLETSLNTSDNAQSNNINKINLEKSNNDSYYDYIIDNIYDDINKDNNISKERHHNSIREINKNDDSICYITFKKKMNEKDIINKNDNDNINIIKYKKYKPISICNKKKEMNSYYNEENKIMSSTFSNNLKKNNSIKTNISYKNEFNENNIKKINKININYKNNKSYNNIRDGLCKEKQKEQSINYNNSKKNYISLINDNNSDKLKEEVNYKFKEKVMLLLNLCRKYANKFNKLFPLCENSLLSDNNNILNHNSIKELKNTIIQFNNMIFNDGINKIFDLDNNNKIISYNLKEINEYEKKYEELKNQHQKLINKNEKLNLEIKELNNKIKQLKIIETKYNNQINLINELNDKIKLLSNEIKNKDNIIKNFENKINKNNLTIKEFNGLNNDLNQNIFINNHKSVNQINNKIINNKSNNIKDESKNIINENILEKKEIKNGFNNIENKSINNINNNSGGDKLKLKGEEENHERLNSEIEQLDNEIYNLKFKLKKLIQN